MAIFRFFWRHLMKLAAYFLMSGSLLLAAMPARANSDMQKEIDDLREDLMVLQRQIYRGAGSSNESSKSAAVSPDQALPPPVPSSFPELS